MWINLTHKTMESSKLNKRILVIFLVIFALLIIAALIGIVFQSPL